MAMGVMNEEAANMGSGLATKYPRKVLLDGLNIVGKAVASRTSLPILTHVLISQSIDSGHVTMMGTDLEMWIQHTLPSAGSLNLSGGGAVTAPARNLAELLAAMPETEVELSAVGPASDSAGRTGRTSSNGMHLRAGRASYNLLGLEPDEFPVLPKVAETTRLILDRVALHAAIKQVIFAAATDDARPILTGVLLSCRDGQLRLVATDTHRLAVRECPVANVVGQDCGVVIPVRAIAEIGRLISGEVGESEPGDRQIALAFSENQVRFEMQDSKTSSSTTLISRLIEGQFPSYERVVPQTWERKLTIERESLQAAVKRASIVARAEGSANRLVLRVEGDGADSKLTITATNGNLGNAFEEIDIAKEGVDAPIDIAFNAKYLQDVLGVLEGDGLYLELTEPLRPGIVRPAEDSSYFCVLMPMQVV